MKSEILLIHLSKGIQNQYILKKAFRSVHREWLSKPEILVKYGKLLTKDQIKELDSYKIDYTGNNLMMIKAVNNRTGSLMSEGILAE